MTNENYLRKNQRLVLPDLSEKFGLSSPDFLIQDIFQGGMGICAKIKGGNEISYALKIIHNSLLEDKLVLHRYIEEMKTWLAISACNGVAEAFCLTKVNEIPCIAARWLDKGNLRLHMSQQNPELFYRSIDRVASTLDWIFDNYSIIHRDLKPENLLMDNNDDVFIADWGLSRSISKPSEETSSEGLGAWHSKRIEITEAGSFLGTILYASPEQILGAKSIDQRSDIYSLGCIMYEWETGKPPFIANTPQEIAIQHIEEKPKKFSGIFKKTHFNVERIILKCLEKDPEKRYQTYSEFLSEFNEVAGKRTTYKKFIVTERYKVPFVGEDEFVKNIKEKKLNAVLSKDGKHAIIELSKVDPYLNEGDNLLVLGEYEKAKNIFEAFYIHDVFKKIPNSSFVQYICVNYAYCLRYLGEIENSIAILRTFDEANLKPVAYYLNLSMLYLLKRDLQTAETICREGISKYPNDSGLLGNLTLALSAQHKNIEALESAKQSLALSKNVHSLEEAAGVIYNIAESQKNIEFPDALGKYKVALNFLREAKKLNPKFESARLSISHILFKLRRYDESTDEASQVLETTKVHKIAETAVFYIARNLLWTNSLKECVNYCKEHMEHFPESIFLKRIYSESLFEKFALGKHEEGERIIDTYSFEFFSSIINDSTNRVASDFKFLAQIHAWMGDEDNVNHAISLLHQGLFYFPDYWKYNYQIATIYWQHNYLDDALEQALEAMKKAPWREKVYFLLSSIYKDKGDLINSNKYEHEGEKIKAIKKQLYA